MRTALADHAYVHFACHGVTSAETPSASRLLVHDHRTRPLTVLDISRLHLSRARLAVLSACYTARGTSDLADEAIHITSALQLAGYPHVVGTLWHVNDLIASRIAIAFHAELLQHRSGATPDPRRSAAALHHVIRDFREAYLDTPTLWVGHVYAGA